MRRREPEVVAETIGLAIDAKAGGSNLEESFMVNGMLREAADQATRIRRARQAADAINFRFFINARTDIFFQRPPERHNDAMVVETIERARAYADAEPAHSTCSWKSNSFHRFTTCALKIDG